MPIRRNIRNQVHLIAQVKGTPDYPDLEMLMNDLTFWRLDFFKKRFGVRMLESDQRGDLVIRKDKIDFICVQELSGDGSQEE